MSEKPVSRSDLLSPSQARRMESRCDAFEAAWKGDGRPNLEEYLRGTPAEEIGELLRELLAIEVAYRRQRGETPTLDDYQPRFPGQRGNIQALFEDGQSQTEIPPQTHDSTTCTLPDIPRYEILEEIGRGGMGVVLRVRDPEFERALAVKVMLPGTCDEHDARKRFLEEAKLTGHLQHPGIPPVHELGRLADGLPFFAMKLVNGQTLAKMLNDCSASGVALAPRETGSERESLTQPRSPEELPRFIAIFGQICQTVAYAHSRRVIHRDLKPSNVMVGAFGEVQVMDWGLAKQIDRLGEEADAPVTDFNESDSLQMRGDLALSQTGQVMGTPAYMAPEQARGEIHTLDPRCDVFGLGAILCEMLTGKPAFQGVTSLDMVRQAVVGNLSDAFERLDGCEADANLIALCKKCLAADKEQRPADARAVADAIDEYQSGVQERLRQSERERAAAQARSHEERKRRRIIVLSAAVVALLAIALSGTYLWYQSDRARRRYAAEQAIQTALGESEAMRDKLHDQLKRKGGVFDLINDVSAWQEKITKARETLARAQSLQRQESGNVDDGLLRNISLLGTKVRKMQADLHLAVELEEIRMSKSFFTRSPVWLPGIGKGKKNSAINNEPPRSQYDIDKTSAKYLRAFKNAGYSFSAEKENQIAKRLKRSAIWEQLVIVLDDWAAIAHRAENRKLHRRLLKIARLADSDRWSKQLRNPAIWDDKEALQKLVETAPMNRRSPQTWLLLGELLRSHKIDAGDWFRRAQRRFPKDFWINMLLGNSLIQKNPRDAVGFYLAAAAIRPRSIVYNNLGNALYRTGNAREAFVVYEKAHTLDPKNSYACFHLGQMYNEMKEYTKAISFFKKTLELDSQAYNAHNDLGHVYAAMGKRDEALASFRNATKLKPDFTTGWYNLGNELRDAGRLPDAVRAYETAMGHSPRAADIHNNLGVTLAQLKEYPKAIVHFRKAIALDKDYLFPRLGLAKALMEQGKFAEAVPVWSQAVAMMPEKHPLRDAVQKFLRICKDKSK